MTPDQELQAAGLMRRAQQGDPGAYAELLAFLTAAARRYTRARLGSVPWLDDVVQEILLSVHVARHTYDAGRPFAPWFYAVARSRLVDAIRSQRRLSAREQASPEGHEPVAPVSGGNDDVDVAAIRRALAALPARQRDIIVGLKYRDESVREIARRLGMTESAVKVAAHRGYGVLKRLLGGR